jgi:hypothetical protein
MAVEMVGAATVVEKAVERAVWEAKAAWVDRTVAARLAARLVRAVRAGWADPAGWRAEGAVLAAWEAVLAVLEELAARAEAREAVARAEAMAEAMAVVMEVVAKVAGTAASAALTAVVVTVAVD